MEENWVKSTGVPNSGPPFSLNPDAQAFVPHISNSGSVFSQNEHTETLSSQPVFTSQPHNSTILMEKMDKPSAIDKKEDYWENPKGSKNSGDKQNQRKKMPFKSPPKNQTYSDPRMERENQRKGDSSAFSQKSDLQETARSRRSEQGSFKTMSSSERKSIPESEKEYYKWDRQQKDFKQNKVIVEKEGDLFEEPKDFSLAHCVAEDLKMGSGIAVAFKREFKNVPELLDQKAKQGGLAFLKDPDNNRYIYYLVTKKESTKKPTYLNLFKSLHKMREHMIANEVKKLAIPRLGCGLDRLEWSEVSSMIEYLFKDIEDIQITVCNFQQNEQGKDKPKKTCKLVVEETKSITTIESSTLLLYLTTTKGDQDEIMLQLAKKFNFLPDFKKHQPKKLGDIIYYNDSAKNYGLCGCIVRESLSDEISFKALQMCIQNVNKKNKQFRNDCFLYVAIQSIAEKNYPWDDLINNKIVSMLINYLRDVDVYLCKAQFEEESKKK